MTPCCSYHAAYNVCTTCGEFLDSDEPRYYSHLLRAKHTFWSPAEYECGGPFCLHCWEKEQHPQERERDYGD